LFSSDDIERLEENPMDRVKISYFTDALCVWAYVSQVRIDELKASFVVIGITSFVA
jgi:hypothetical protein